MKINLVSRSALCVLAFLAGFSALVLLPAISRADTSLQVSIAPPGSANESNRTACLTWAADAGNNYLVQSSTNVGNPAAWTTEDAVSQTNVGPIKWMAPEALRDRKYYRLILPQPQIFSVEPAIVAPGVPVNLYVLGQSFPTNALLQINGVTQSNAVVVSSSLATVPGFVPDVAGNYKVSLVVSSSVLVSFTVVCADPLANPELVLQGPPTEPPASPSAFWLSKKGYDYYKAQSDFAAKKDFKGHVTLLKAFDDSSDDIQEGKKDFKGHVTLLKAFDDDSGDSAKHTKTGHVTLMKAFDDGSDDIQEGKKGLNAVNVKLARMAGGGDGDPTFMAALMKAKEKANQCKCMATVQSFSSEVQECDVDLVISGHGLDFVWMRNYHSRIGRFGTATNGWTFSYDVHCAQNSTGGFDIFDGTGRKDTFTLGTNGVYTCPEFFREGSFSNNTFTLAFADTGRWVFNPFDGTATAGKLIQIITRNGDTMTLGYDTSGRLVQIVDDLGRTNTVAYNTSGQVASVTDFSGRSVTYQYYSGAKADNGSAGDLKSVTSPAVIGTPNGNDFPTGKTTTYTYSKSFPLDRENHLLLTVTDPKGQTAAVFIYEHNAASSNYLRCVSSSCGLSQTFTYSWSLKQLPPGSRAQLNYPSGSNPSFVKCIVNDPVGNVTEDYFDARGRCVLERVYTGRAMPGLPVTDTDNRPTGQVRSTDPAYYDTAWSWNNDSLCTSEISPGGQQMQYVYQSDFDPTTTARKRADCRVVREIATSAVDLNGDGIPDMTSRACYYTYDPRFGSSKCSSEWYRWRKCVLDGKVDRKSISVIFHNDAGEEAAYHAINTKGTGGNTGIADAVTFGREKLKATTKTQGDFNLSNRGKGWDGTIKGLVVPDGNGMAIKTKGTGADHNRTSGVPRSKGWDGLIYGTHRGFPVTATDPRGNVTTAIYDNNGNPTQCARKNLQLGSIAVEDNLAYDTHGQLIAVTNAADANGQRRVDTFSWSQGQITNCVVDAGGLALTSSFAYDPRGNLTRYVDPRTNDWLFACNALDQLVESSSATVSLCFCKIKVDYAYDANDNLVQCSTVVLDPAGNSQGTCADNYRYDALDCLTEVASDIDATHAQTNRFVYDGNNQCVQALGPDAVSGADPHQVMAFEYDERGLMFRAIAAPGSPLTGTNEFSYTANYNPATKKYVDAEDALKMSVFAYDGFDRLASVTDPMGNQSICFYDANDNPKVVRAFGELNDVPGSAGNVRLAESRYEYDGLDRCFRSHDLFFNPATQSVIGSGDAVSSCAYAPNDECVSVTDSLGRTTSYGYDTACRLSSATDARGNISVSVRDQLGNVTSVTSTELPDIAGPPQVFSTTYAYDSLNRCVSASDNVGNTVACAYDSLGRVVRETNPNGNDTTYAYDLLDNCVASTDCAGSSLSSGTPPTIVRSTSATFDTSARCLTSTDPNGNTTSYAYDSLGNCTTVTEADGTHQQLVWSPRSNLMVEQDANGTTVTNGYDLCDRLIHRDIAARGAAVASTTFETFAYDGGSQLVLASNDVSQLIFSYDSLGDCTGSSQDGLVQTASYDSGGNPLSLTYPSGRVVNYAYDALDQVTNISTSANGVSHPQLARFAYAGPGRLARIGRDNGVKTQIDWDGLANPGNSSGDYGWQEVSRVRDGTVAAPSLVCDVAGTYSPAQSKLTRADAGRSGLALTYDALEQLVESSDSVSARDTIYALDAAGNRSHVITNGILMTPDYAMSSALPPGDFFMNRYTTTPFGAQSYDANGNLILRASAASPTFYHYDYADRLVEVDALSTLGTLAPIATFTYDALGNRISKTTYPGEPAAPVTVQDVRSINATIHNGMFLRLPGAASILEKRQGGVVGQTFVHVTGLKEEIRENDNVVFDTVGNARYYHCDDLGNVLALTDAGGNVLERYAYDDYGQPQFLDANGSPLVGSDGQPVTTSPLGNPYLFQGMEWDGESGLLGDGGGNYFDPLTACAIRGKVKSVKIDPNYLIRNNPWSGGDGGPVAMKNGTVKFFNDAKGFGMVVGDSSKTYTKTGHVTLMK